MVLCLLPLAAVGQSVTVVDFAFSPNSLSITAGQTVTWTWSGANGAAHDVVSGSSCSSDGSYSSTFHINSGTFTHQYTVAGTYNYFCSPHCGGGMTGSITVNPGAATHLVLSGVPGTVTAGTPFNATVTAQDFYGNVATGFGGTVSLTGSAGGTLINGQNTFSVTLTTAGFQSITASSGGVTSANASLTVDPAAASQFSVAPLTNPVTAGSVFNVTVTALDPFGNQATTAGTVYTGTVHFTSPGDLISTLPADYHFIAGDNGAHLFSGVILRTSGNQTIKATDTVSSSITGAATVTVNPGPATHFSVAAPPSAFVGLQFNITVTALDQFGNQATSSGTAYTGTVHLTSSDVGATLPADYTFLAGDNGAHVFGVTLNTIGVQSVTVTDTVTSSIHGSTNVTVRPPCPAAPKTFKNTAPISFSTNGTTASTALYPSPITVSGMTGTIGKLTLTLNGYSDTNCAADLAILLQGPHGQFMVPYSLVGPCVAATNNVTLTLDDSATALLPEYPNTLSSGTYRPSSYILSGFGSQPIFQAPAPGGPTYTATQLVANDGTASFASVFNGTDPNGTWNLYVLYQPQLGPGVDSGQIAGGWSLTISPEFTFTNGSAPITFNNGVPNPPTTTNPYPSTINVTGVPGNITKMRLTLFGLTDKCPADLALLLKGPQGQTIVPWSLVGGCTLTTATVGDVTLDDVATPVLPAYNHNNNTAFPAGYYKPSSYLHNEFSSDTVSFVAGAPAGPYLESALDGAATFASVFNGTDPNGTWSLYLQQQFGGGNFDVGQFATGWSLSFVTDCPAGTNCTVSSGTNPSVFGQNVAVLGTVSSGSGTPFSPPQLNFLDGASNFGIINLNGSGQATENAPNFSVGTHPITINYPGNTTFASCTSAILNQVVNKAGTSTVVSSSANPSFFGNAVTFTATVTVNSPGAGTATGPVSFYDGVTLLGSGTLNGVGGNDQATFTTTSPLAVGGHSITAVYAGDGTDYVGSTSAVLTQTVNQGTTTVTVGTSGTPSVFGNSVTFTGTVAVTNGTGTPTGSVTFNDGGVPIGGGTVALSGNTATFPISSLAVGSHTITATYNADTNFSGNTSGPINQNVNKGTTTTTVGTSGSPSVFGNSVMFTATVVVATGAGTPTGTVTFKDGTTTLGSGALNGSGQATFSTSNLAVGGHSITAVYGGDGNFAGSTSAAITQTVNQGTTGTGVGTSGTPSVYGSTVTFTATVTVSTGVGTPTGTVTFSDGVTTLGSGTLNGGGTATYGTSTLSAGSHSITAVYNGNANFTGSTSTSISQVVNQATTTVNLISSQNPSLLAHPVTLTATVNPQFSGIPTGTVTFFDGTTRSTLGTGALDVSGVATLLTSSLGLGSHDITATYNADSNFTGSTSATLTQVVNPLPVPAIAVTSSLNPSAFKQKVTLTATVTPSSATGTVTFMDGSRSLGTATLIAGVATLTTSQWNIGARQVTAVYGGDFNFGIATSPVLVERRSPKPH